MTCVQLFAVAGDDEEGVVDPDAEADHHPECGGEVRHLEEVRDEHQRDAADADAGEGDADGQAHGQHRSERDDQDDDRERQAEQFGLRRLELLEDVTAVLELNSVDARSGLGDLGTLLLCGHQIGAIGDLDGGVGDRAGVGARERDALGATRQFGQLRRIPTGARHQPLHERGVRIGLPGREGAGDRDVVPLADLGEELLEIGAHGLIVESLLGPHHDGALESGARPAHLALQDVEALLGLDVREAELGGEVRSDRTGQSTADDEDQDPRDDHGPATSRAPRAQTAEHDVPPRQNGGARAPSRCPAKGRRVQLNK